MADGYLGVSPVDWLWLVLWVGAGVAGTALLLLTALHVYLRIMYAPLVVRIFQEKPLFIIPRGQPLADAETSRFRTADGLSLCGSYLKALTPQRKGVILFGLEFGSNRWAAGPYCEFLRRDGFDVFTFESRCQGESDAQPGYDPLQWVTDYEVQDFRAALEYLRSRGDADPKGVGLFGISKGGSAGLLTAAKDPYVRCFVTDGIFATHTTMLPYMRKWISIYSDKYWIQHILPNFVYRLIAHDALWQIQRQRHCRFAHLERAIGRLGDRPLLMIHGEGDTYIKPEMARELFERVRGPKELWMVEKAKHNQAFHLANGEYQRRVLAFFRTHLAGEDPFAATGGERKEQAAGNGGPVEVRKGLVSDPVPSGMR
ncbi:MAG: alpha/beta fold hydrolase [Gemmataceae bacterium]|nr:alpha/beta fold hydrolase [Gemmataceae bacterium]